MYKNNKSLILASSSPRRKDLLTSLNIDFSITTKEINEDQLQGETKIDYLKRISVSKGKTIALENPNKWVLSADTLVAIDEQIFRKPQNSTDARATLSKLSNKTHSVLTAYTLQHYAEQISITKIVSTKVVFKKLKPQVIDAYIKSNEVFGKAGSYAIQGFGATLVQSIDGSYTNVVGLPISTLVDDLLDLKIIALK